MDFMEAGKARVAVAEAEYLLRETLTRLIAEAGLRIVGDYEEPEELLSRLGEDRPTVALLGLSMAHDSQPLRPDGLAVVRELHRRHPDVGIVVFADASHPDAVERCYQEGACAYLDRHSARRESVVETLLAAARGERMFPIGLLSSGLTPSARTPEAPLLRSISPREREVLSFIAAGADNLKIATLLHISERTVKAHVTSLYRKLGSGNRIQLALEARQLGVRPSAFS